MCIIYPKKKDHLFIYVMNTKLLKSAVEILSVILITEFRISVTRHNHVLRTIFDKTEDISYRTHICIFILFILSTFRRQQFDLVTRN